MDVDAFVMANEPTWSRLQQLVKRRGRLTGPEADELVELYQRTATHLSVLRTTTPDPHLVGRLTALVASARGVSGGAREVGWRSVGTYFTRTLPAVVWQVRWWWLGAAVFTLSLSVAEAVWIGTNPDVQSSLLPASEIRDLDKNFVEYYRESPNASFFAKVWTNNALITVALLVSGFVVVGPLVLLVMTAVGQLGPAAGYLFAEGKGGLFLEYILPHGLLELSTLFLGGGAGLRVGWTLLDPGRGRTRVRALAEEGRRTIALAGGVVVMLLLSGLLEGFVTPSRLPAWFRVGLGAVVWAVVVGGLLVMGRRAARAGLAGDLDADLAGGTDRTV